MRPPTTTITRLRPRQPAAPAALATTALARAPTTPSSTTTRRSFSRLFPQPPVDPRRRAASTSASNTDWLAWLKKAGPLAVMAGDETPRRALILPGLGSYPHTPQAATPSSIAVWEQASEALLNPDATIGYWTEGMEEFAGMLQGGGGHGMRGWLRGWVEGRSLDELMARADVTAAFILSSSIAILASEQERSGSSSLLPKGTGYLAGHGFVGTLTALVASGRLDLTTGVRLARMYASLPASPPLLPNQRHATTVLSARHYHSLSSPSQSVPFEDPFGEWGDVQRRKRAMQLILDEVHALQHEWEVEGQGDWAEAAVINSSKVLSVTGTSMAVEQLIDRLQSLTLANPVMDVNMPCPYHTRLMLHAVPKFADTLQRCIFSHAKEGDPVILDPITTRNICGSPEGALLSHLTNQLRWHKTLTRIYSQPSPPVDQFLTVGRGAKGLGVMLRGELKKRPAGAPPIAVDEYGVQETHKAEVGAASRSPNTRPVRPVRIQARL
ncbi:hypothetical protein VHUM_01147 [Vanrija humicola]|uniref:[acyl-carrier-protein] S-malonyltransferase n=1 Tax=Vanrija humicola TaxID=5417 RepID=A0A7D8V2G2_VANHU|nr:hypothetical protein VHUM_01147 [Vanrija humicola]